VSEFEALAGEVLQVRAYSSSATHRRRVAVELRREFGTDARRPREPGVAEEPPVGERLSDGDMLVYETAANPVELQPLDSTWVTSSTARARESVAALSPIVDARRSPEAGSFVGPPAAGARKREVANPFGAIVAS